MVVDLIKEARAPKSILDDLLHGNATSIDSAKREAIVKTGKGDVAVAFDKLILAVGAVPWVPPTPGALKVLENN